MSSNRNTSRADQTARKVRLAVRSLEQLAQDKQRRGAWGQVVIKLSWEEGHLKMVEISDTTTFRDLPPSQET
ncbi:MAG: hypothetical protein NZ700_13780 [Gemmataceae bacterium]|nr:hypothetical protein [Gemmataceae bacterium]MDW8266863.1 hypothetical protein [Gemmataceae bacterium]